MFRGPNLKRKIIYLIDPVIQYGFKFLIRPGNQRCFRDDQERFRSPNRMLDDNESIDKS